MNIAQRFWSKVRILDATSCWEWQALRCRNGYGRFKIGGAHKSAHRVAYELHFGAPLSASVDCLHKCDNRRCVNPLHLWLGTHIDNMHDMCAKGRHRGSSKLTDYEVISIFFDRRPIAAIAEEFNTDSGTVSRIKSRKKFARIWREIADAGVLLNRTPINKSTGTTGKISHKRKVSDEEILSSLRNNKYRITQTARAINMTDGSVRWILLNLERKGLLPERDIQQCARLAEKIGQRGVVVPS